MKNRIRIFSALAVFVTISVGSAGAQSVDSVKTPVYVVPNFHPASCGWLTDWSVERNYIANSYLDHLDKVAQDQNYKFVLSECNNMIAIANFTPDRFEELKRRIDEGRVELPNAFFLESTINLSGGEALVRMGVEGLRWQKQVMGVRPRHCWTIDVCGTHSQMPQICAGLGLEGLIYFRNNPFGRNVFWSKSPDGSKVLTFSPGFYAVMDPLFTSAARLDETQLGQVADAIDYERSLTPDCAPVLALGGHGDYSLSPRYEGNPTEFLAQWKDLRPGEEIEFATFSEYFDAVSPLVYSGEVEVPTLEGGTSFSYHAFWVDNPRAKQWFRRNEHYLQAAEALAAAASLEGGYEYPAQEIYHAWLQLLLCMDRNSLWGSAGGMVFEHDESWDVKDRHTWVGQHAGAISRSAVSALLPEGKAAGVFNPAGVALTVPVALDVPAGKSIAGVKAEALPDGRTLCMLPCRAMELRGAALKNSPPPKPVPIALPQRIETPFYSVSIDPRTGSISSLKLKPGGEELLGGNGNVFIIEQSKSKYPGDFLEKRSDRILTASSDDYTAEITVTEGPLAITVVAQSDFYGGSKLQRLVRFYKDSPRIDFETDVNDIPDMHVAFAEFPMSSSPSEIRKGIPYGFEHTTWPEPETGQPCSGGGIQPAVRWSDYQLASGSGLAMLDRGLTGREIDGGTPVIYMLNATETYWKLPNSWLTGAGHHRFEYAVVPRDSWSGARIPQLAWEYNSTPVIVAGSGKKSPRCFVKSSDNVIIEALRREGDQIELRFAECLGEAGECILEVGLPHTAAWITDMTGANPVPLKGENGSYTISVRPQQIVTVRLQASSSVADITPLTRWDELVPENKRKALNIWLEGKKGHPPRFFD